MTLKNLLIDIETTLYCHYILMIKDRLNNMSYTLENDKSGQSVLVYRNNIGTIRGQSIEYARSSAAHLTPSHNHQ